MRNILCLLIFAFTTVAVHAVIEEERMKVGLATLFAISLNETEACLEQTKVVPDDMALLERTVMETTDVVNKESLRRASCTLSCLANAQGTMTGAKIEVSKVHHVIHKSLLPPEDKEAIQESINFCSEQVKHITDKCDVCFEFIKCVRAQLVKYQI